MKKTTGFILTLFISCALYTPTPTEASDWGDDEGEVQTGTPDWGGFGFFSPGVFMGAVESVEQALESESVLGPPAGIGVAGWTIGGGGWSLMAERFLLGGHGFGMFYPSASTNRGTAVVTGGGGSFDVGYAILNQDQWLLFPFLGAGGMDFTVEITNESSNPMSLGAADEIPVAESRSFNFGFWTFEAGVGLQRLFHDGLGGFQLGAELGFIMSVSEGQWYNAIDESAVAVSKAGLMGGFFRITIGGGGFELTEPDDTEFDDY